MQERKFDYNQIIGFVLIFLLLGGFFYLNRPSEEELKAQEEELKKQEQLKEQAVAEAKIEQSKTLAIDSLAQEVEAEGEQLMVKFSTRGGQISELKMKQYYAYDSTANDHHKPLYLIKNNSKFGLSFTDTSGRVVKTSEVPFTPLVQKQGKNTLVKMSANIGGGQLNYLYTIKDNYSIDFKIQTTGLKSITNDNQIAVDWYMNAFALEKGRQQELQYTDTHFRIKEDEDQDYDRGEWDEKEKVDWVAFKQQFFASILNYEKGFDNSNGNVIAHPDDFPTYIKEFAYNGSIPVNGQELNETLEWDFVPLESKVLKEFDDKGYSEIIPFGLWGGGGFIGWLNRYFFLNVYKWLIGFGIAAGWVIVLMTIVVKLIMSPVMYRQFRQSAMMKVLKPEMEAINEKYKGQENAMKRQQEVMALQRSAGVNMLAGCIPALLQMPLFYALFRFFPNLFDLRGKSFWWAEDLTSYDSIVNLPFNIPFLGSHISLFALLYVVVMIIYFRVSGSMNNFAQNQPKQEGMPDMSFMKYMMYIMPIFFFVFLNNYASGLSLYYLVSNGINIGIVLFIKNVLLDEEKIHAKVAANKEKSAAKPKKKKSKWRAKMDEMMEQAQKQQELQKKNKKKK